MNQRYFSLDVFRGATVALMILVNNPGSWSHIFAPLEHAEWHGCTPTDLVFPFFLFAVGNAMAFVIPRLQLAGDAVFWKKVLRRFFLIFAIGILLSWSPFVLWQDGQLVPKGWTWTTSDGQLHGVRVMGVLQRIALCYLLASILLYYFKLRTALIVSALLLLAYWGMCLLLSSSPDPLSLQGYFGTQWDINLFGEAHVYHGEGVAFDPEGVASTLPAVVQVVFGYAAGAYIRRKPKMYNMLTHLFVAAALLIFAGFAWDLIFPINKKIWTSSYVLYTSGLAMMVLGVVIYALEFRSFHTRRLEKKIFSLVRWFLVVWSVLLASVYVVIHFREYDLATPIRFIQWVALTTICYFFLSILSLNRWSNFFNVFGKNPLFIFVLSGFLPRLLGLIRIPGKTDANGEIHFLSPFGWWYEYVCKPFNANQKFGSLIYALSIVLMFWAIAWVMDKRKIYVKV